MGDVTADQLQFDNDQFLAEISNSPLGERSVLALLVTSAVESKSYTEMVARLQLSDGVFKKFDNFERNLMQFFLLGLQSVVVSRARKEEMEP